MTEGGRKRLHEEQTLVSELTNLGSFILKPMISLIGTSRG